MTTSANLQTLVDQALIIVRAHPQHQLDWQLRRAMYTAFGEYTDLSVTRARGRLAILSAQKVYPIFHAAYLDDDLPESLLRAAVGLLDGTVTQDEAAEIQDIGYHIFGNDLYDELNVQAAGYSAYKALMEVRGWRDPFEQVVHGGVLNQSGERVPFTDQELASLEAGDTAGTAAIAFAGNAESDALNVEKLLSFWEWWLIEAIPLAWDFDVQIVAISAQKPIQSRDPQVYFAAGLRAAQKSSYRKALTAFNEAIRLDPEQAKFYMERGSVRGNKSDYEGAISDLDRALTLDPSLADGYFRRGEVNNWRNNYQAAIADLSQFINLKPDEFLGFSERGSVHWKIGDHKSAFSDFNEAIRLNPTRWFSYVQRGRERHELGDPNGAISDYITALRNGHRLFGNEVRNLQLDAIIAAHPEYSEAYTLRALMGDVRNREVQVLADYSAAIMLSPNDPRAYLDRAYFYEFSFARERIENKFTALYSRRDMANDYRQALELDPNLPDAVKLRERLAQIEHKLADDE